MKRDIKKNIEEGKRLVGGTRKDLAASELYELIEDGHADADAVIDAFYLGVAVGRKAAAK
jgi:hypothetical protein